MRQLYEARIIDPKEDGIICISLVESPAIESDYVMMSSEKKDCMRFSIVGEEKRLISGPLMLADVPILRRSGDLEYYIKFSKDTIRRMSEVFLDNNLHHNFDIQHDGNLIDPSKIKLQEIYITDNYKKFQNQLPEGSLVVTLKIEDDSLWESLKKSDLRGFSLEGIFSLSPVEEDENEEEETLEVLKKACKYLR